jgi:L-histidine Nalpha-methyltransferase
MPVALPEPRRLDDRLSITVLHESAADSGLAADVIRGLISVPKELPPKYFYDQRGSQLFDAICDTPEYYPTRTEEALLTAVAGDIVAAAEAAVLVELGSGAARKTRVLLDALARGNPRPVYMPIDISEAMLVDSARGLLADYPTLAVHGVVADYDHHMHLLPSPGGHRLIAFLGSTLGNFDEVGAVDFLADIAGGMTGDDTLLLGLDLVKSPAVLHAAYNDEAGVTARFNLNVLEVLNRELGADFDLDAFEHLARYLPERERIEMYLRARRDQRVTIAALDRCVPFSAGEEMRTEISRKFTRQGAETRLSAAGLTLDGWHASPDEYFALCTARPAGPPR